MYVQVLSILGSLRVVGSTAPTASGLASSISILLFDLNALNPSCLIPPVDLVVEVITTGSLNDYYTITMR